MKRNMRSLRQAGLPLATVVLLLASVGCSRSSTVAYQDNVQKALEQADYQGLSVAEDVDKNTITLTGKLHSADAKQKAANVAKSAAGERIVANEISVEPLGVESEAKKMESSLDDGIESNYKAALISKGLDKQDISFKSKNGVITLSGKVKTGSQRQEAGLLATNTPNVVQVLDQIEVKR
jgi:hyperosmotically inducible periplasmic protein